MLALLTAEFLRACAHRLGKTRGVIDARDAVFFLSVIFCFLLANAVLVDLKKAA